MFRFSKHPIFTFFLCASFLAGLWIPDGASQSKAADSTLHKQGFSHAAAYLTTGYDTADSDSSTRNSGAASAGISLLPSESLSYEEKLAVIENNSIYPQDMVTFAQKYPQTIDYVYNYPQHLSGTSSSTESSSEASAPGVPLLLQWDARWGYVPYGSGLIGYTGCGPTCLSMAAISLTRDARYTPAYVADLATRYGYVVPGSGSSWTLISEGCELLGLSARQLSPKEDQMKQALDAHCPIIAVVGPGDFTYTGHFIVITGYTAQGFTVNDPNSQENSEKCWSFEQLKGQIKNLWAMSS